MISTSPNVLRMKNGQVNNNEILAELACEDYPLYHIRSRQTIVGRDQHTTHFRITSSNLVSRQHIEVILTLINTYKVFCFSITSLKRYKFLKHFFSFNMMRRMNDFCYFVMEKMGFLSMEYFIKRPKIQRKRLYYGISKFLTLLPINILLFFAENNSNLY